MDKCARTITRDVSSVIKYINLETDKAKRERLLTLYHDLRWFTECWDGVTADQRQTVEFAKHAIHVWEKMLEQDGYGRKLLITTIGGFTTGLDTWYWAYWGTVNGVNKTELDQLQTQLSKWKAILEAHNTLDTIDTDEGNNSIVNSAITVSDDGFGLVITDSPIASPRPAAIDEVHDPNVTRDIGNATAIITGPSIGAMVDDSGFASRTIESIQNLPKPNVTIDVLDGDDGNDFSDDEWFNNAAIDIINQSTPSQDEPIKKPEKESEAKQVQKKRRGNEKSEKSKFTIVPVPSDPDFFIFLEEGPHKHGRMFFDFDSLVDHIKNRVVNRAYLNSPPCDPIEKLDIHYGLASVVKLPFYRTFNYLSKNYATMGYNYNNNIDSVPNRPPRLGDIGRQNAIRTPNPTNSRLHNRRGSRQSSGRKQKSSVPADPAPAQLPAPIESNLANFESNIQKEIKELQDHLESLAARLKISK